MSSILVEENEFVLNITLNSPKNHNAFNAEMVHDLKEAFDSVVGRKQIRAVYLRGEGKSFCAGADLNYMKGTVEDSLHDNIVDAQKLFDMFLTGSQVAVPVVGKIHGHVFGGGLGLTAICDIAIADRGTQFCFSEVKLGLVPAVISPFILKRIRFGAARELMLTARRFDASYAKEIGLVHYVESSDDGEKRIRETLDMIKDNGPEAVKRTKGLLNYIESGQGDTADLRKRTSSLIAESRMCTEGQSGLRSFFEKVPPQWKQKK